MNTQNVIIDTAIHTTFSDFSIMQVSYLSNVKTLTEAEYRI